MKLFGTDGIRNVIGSAPFNFEHFSDLIQAVALWAKEKHKYKNKNKACFILCHDTRASAYWLISTIKSILLLNNISVIDANILPTPVLFYLIKESKKITCGIVISASHNPHHDNGLKIIDKTINKISKIDINSEIKIEEIFNNLSSNFNYKFNYKKLGTEIFIKSIENKYIKKITKIFKLNFLKNIKIVLDTSNGATYKIAPIIFKKLGAQLTIINNKPNGKNINKNCGSQFPKSLINTVLTTKSDIGLAFDGDGDRVVAVNRSGQIKDGDDILAILSEHPDYKHKNQIVGTVMSNFGLEEFFRSKNKSLIRASVGDKYISKELDKNNLLLGGESSGHIILKDIINTSDGILTALKLIETLKLTGNWDLETFTKYPQVNLNIKIKHKKDLNLSPIKDIIVDSNNQLKNGRLVVRYSGTENYLRIMAETKQESYAQAIALDLANKLKEHIEI